VVNDEFNLALDSAKPVGINRSDKLKRRDGIRPKPVVELAAHTRIDNLNPVNRFQYQLIPSPTYQRRKNPLVSVPEQNIEVEPKVAHKENG
jgi:hypothetical protein